MASIPIRRNARRWIPIIFIALACALLFATAPQSFTRVPAASAQVGGLQVSAGGPYSGQVGQPIVFSAQAFFGGLPATVAQFQWSFGDGGTGFGQTATHAYAVAGTYTVTVTATTATGQSGFATTTAQIGTFAQGQIQVSAGGPYSGQVGFPITFTAQALTGLLPVGFAAQFQWDFGDGGTAVGQTTSHTYASPGTYTVTVFLLTQTGLPAGLAGTATTTAVVSGGSASTTSTSTEQIALYADCNNVAVTWPNSTPVSTVAAAISPAGALIAIWHFDNLSQHFTGYSSLPGAPNDLTTVNRADPVFICMNAAGTLTRPVI